MVVSERIHNLLLILLISHVCLGFKENYNIHTIAEFKLYTFWMLYTFTFYNPNNRRPPNMYALQNKKV